MVSSDILSHASLVGSFCQVGSVITFLRQLFWKINILVFQASALIAYLPLILLSDVAVLAHALLCEWTVPTSVPLPEPVSPCLFHLMPFFLDCYILVVQASTPSVCLALYSPFWSTRVLAHILLREWQVLTSFPMSYFCMQRPSKMVFLICCLCEFSFWCYVDFW